MRQKKKCQLGENPKLGKAVIEDAQKEDKTVHFATLMDVCHLKDAELVLIQGQEVIRTPTLCSVCMCVVVFVCSRGEVTCFRVHKC